MQIKQCVISVALLYMLSASLASAEVARVRISPASGDLRPGSEFVVHVLVDSEQPLNAYSVTVGFDPGTAEFLSTDTSKSIINVWQQLPVVSAQGSIRFNGASVTPFIGTGGELYAIRFRAIGEVSVPIRVSSAAVYLANGKGTKVLPAISGADFGIATATTPPQDVVPDPPELVPDTAAPLISFMEFATDPLNSERKLAAFVVEDRESGVNEVSIRSRSWLGWSTWQIARNPTAFSRGVWAVELRVRDHAGNEIYRSLYDPETLILKIGALLVSVLLIGGLLHVRLRGRFRA